jgi:hypothetical protein
MKLRFVAMTGVLSLAGLGLVGAGAHAVFSTNVTATQQITSGSLHVAIWDTLDLTCPNAAANCQATTLATPPAVGSSFVVGPEPIYVTNNGTLPAFWTGIGMTDQGTGDSSLASESYLCLQDSNHNVLYNGPFSSASTFPEHDSIPTSAGAGNYILTYVTFYAGPTTVEPCGDNIPFGVDTSTTNPAALSLGNEAEGETMQPTFTFSFTG